MVDISLQFPIIIIISPKIKVEPLFVIDQHVQEVLDRNTIQAENWGQHLWKSYNLLELDMHTDEFVSVAK